MNDSLGRSSTKISKLTDQLAASEIKIAAVGTKVAANKQLQVCAALSLYPIDDASVGADGFDVQGKASAAGGEPSGQDCYSQSGT